MMATVKLSVRRDQLDLPLRMSSSVTFLLAATHYKVNPDGKYKLWNSVSTDKYIRYYGI